MGSFQTMTTQGRSGSASVSPTGWSVSTGAVAGPAVTTGPIVARRGSRRRRVGTRTPPRGGRLGGARTQRRPPVGGQRARLLGPGPGRLGQRQPQAQHGEPHEEGAEHVEADEPGGDAGEVLPVAEGP